MATRITGRGASLHGPIHRHNVRYHDLRQREILHHERCRARRKDGVAYRRSERVAFDNAACGVRTYVTNVGGAAVRVLLLLEEDEDELEIYRLSICGADRGLDHGLVYIPL